MVLQANPVLALEMAVHSIFNLDYTMKKIVFSTLAVLSAAMLVLSCAKENSVNEPQNDGEIHVTINAGKAVLESSTKTEIYNNAPYWSVGDAIGVSDGESKNKEFTTAIVNRSSAADFSGTVDAAGDYYAYYPYTSTGVGTVSEKQGAKVDLPANQYPTATSFDGSADIMVSKKFTVTETNPTISDLQFARLGAIVKIVLKDTESLLGGQHPTTVSMTAASNLAGRVVVNMKDQCVEQPYYNQSTTVTANYTSLTKYEINGTNATYLIVYPQTLAAGSTLTIAASTEGYSIEKDITIPAGGITLEPGKITTLNISLTSSHISASSGLALPFNDNFSWQTGTNSNTAVNFATTPGIPNEKYSAQDKVYQGNAAGEIKFGTGSAIGYLTTVELDLSSAFYVHINAKNFNATACTMNISVDDGAPQSVILTDSYADYYFNFAAATNKSKVKISTTSSGYRSFVQQFDVISGTYVFPPVINVTSANPMAVANTISSQTITYSISNSTGGATFTAALQDPSDTWISDIDYSTTDGEVTFNVAAQGSGNPSRSAVIVLSYTGAADVEVTVNQAAGPGGVSKGDTKTYSISSSTSNAQSFNKLLGNTDPGNFDHASSKSITLDSHTWTISTEGNGSVIYAGGQQLGAGDKSGTKRDVTGVTMITSAYTAGIETITVSSSTNGSGTLSVYVNDVLVETAKALADDVVYTLDSVTTGEIRLVWAQSTAGKNITIKSITIN